MEQRRIKKVFELLESGSEKIDLILECLESMSDNIDCHFSYRKIPPPGKRQMKEFDWIIFITVDGDVSDIESHFFDDGSDISLLNQLDIYTKDIELETSLLKLAVESIVRSGVKYQKVSIGPTSGFDDEIGHQIEINILFNKE